MVISYCVMTKIDVYVLITQLQLTANSCGHVISHHKVDAPQFMAALKESIESSVQHKHVKTVATVEGCGVRQLNPQRKYFRRPV